MSTQSKSLILASASKARFAMLSQAGVDVRQLPVRVDEQSIKESMQAESHPPRDIADALAEMKAARGASKYPGELVLGADQILVSEGHVFDKPKDIVQAKEQLLSLKGKTHQLLSAVVLMQDQNVTFRHISSAKLAVRSFSEDFLDHYLARENEELLHCVGAYRLEGMGAQLFDRIDGDYFTVLGLPLLPVLAHLRIQGYLTQ